MEELIICETNRGNFAVRPINWAGIWDIDERLKETGANCPALFRTKEDAEEYVRIDNLKESSRLLELPYAVGDTIYEVFYDELNNP